MLRSLARAIVNRYPAAWRERYADEVMSLIEAGPVRLSDVCGLLRHCITERTLALYEPSRHISAFRLISGISLMAFISVLVLGTFAVSALPFLLGAAIRQVAGPFPASLTDAVEWALLPFFLVAIVWSWFQIYRIQFRQMPVRASRAVSAIKFRWILVACYGGMSVLGGITSDLSFGSSYSYVLLPWMLLTHMFEPQDGIQWPGSGLFETLGRLRSVRYDLRWARMELDRCEGIYAGREPGPDLRAARAEMARLTAAEADAMASLDAMGYHARFAA